MNKGKISLRALLDDPRSRAVISLLCAVMLWTTVTIAINPGAEITVRGIPVDFTYGAGGYTSLGLDIIDHPEMEVSVYCTGDGVDLGSLNESSFLVYPDYSAVKGSGKVNLPLKVEVNDTRLANRVTVELASGQSSTVEIVFDTVVERTFRVSTQIEGLQLAAGYVLNRTTVSPAEITVTGPESELDLINRVVAPVAVNGELADSAIIQAELELRDQYGQPMTLEYAEPSATMADVSFVVNQIATLPLTVDFINTPPGFDVSKLPYTLSQQTLTVSGPTRKIATMTELSVGYFDLSTFAMDDDWALSIELPEDVVNQENVSAVTLSFDSSKLATKTLNVSEDNIRVINLPSNYQLEVETNRINNVVLVGPTEEIENLSASSVVARIDAQDIQVTVGQQNVAVEIYVPSSTGIFAVGTYTVQCAITSE